jgi:hypothetical protein
MKKIKICLDVDGVLLNFLQTISNFIEKRYGVKATIEHSCSQWNLRERFDKEWIEKIGFDNIKKEFEKDGFWEFLESMPEIDKIHELFNNPLFDLLFLTQIPTHLHEVRSKNLSALIGKKIESESLICVPLGESKRPYVEKIKPDYFIEDSLHNLRDCHSNHVSIWIDHNESYYDRSCLSELPILKVSNLNEAIIQIQKDLINNNQHELIEKIQHVLTKDLLTSKYKEIAKNHTEGHCYAASEALFYLLGGKHNGFTPQVATFEKNGGKLTHWWIKDSKGKVLDPTSEQFYASNMTPPYDVGKNIGFLTKYPSKRARTIIERIVSNNEDLINDKVKIKKKM